MPRSRSRSRSRVSRKDRSRSRSKSRPKGKVLVEEVYVFGSKKRGRSRSHSKKKKTPPHLLLWKKACQKHGYMLKGKGKFQKVPKKGTPEYKKIKATYEKMKK